MELRLYLRILLAIEVMMALLKISYAHSSKSDKFKYHGSTGDFLLPQLEKSGEHMSHDFHFEPHHIQELREIYSTKNRVKKDAILKESIVRVKRSPQFGLSSKHKQKAKILLNDQVPDTGRLSVDLPDSKEAISNSASLLNLNENLNLKPKGDISLNLGNGEKDFLSGEVGANVDLEKVVPKIGGEVDINIGNLDGNLKIGKLGKIGLPKIKFGSSDRDKENDEETNSEDEIKSNLNTESDNTERLRLGLPKVDKAISNSASILNLNENLSGGIGIGANVDLDKVVPKIGGEVDINIGNLDGDLKIGKLGKVGLPKIKLGSSDRDRKNDEETNSEDEIKLNLDSEIDNTGRLRLGLPKVDKAISNSASLLNLNENLSGGIGANVDLDKVVPKIGGEVDINIGNLDGDLKIGKLGKIGLPKIKFGSSDRDRKNDEETNSEDKLKLNLNSESENNGRLRLGLPKLDKAISNSASLNENLSGGIGANVDLDKVVPKIGGEVDINIGNLDGDLKIGKLGKIGLPKIKFGSSDRDRKKDEETNSEDKVKSNLNSESENTGRLRLGLPKVDKAISNSASLNENLSGGVGANVDLDKVVPKIGGEVDINIGNVDADLKLGKFGKIGLPKIKFGSLEGDIKDDNETNIKGETKLNIDSEKTYPGPLRVDFPYTGKPILNSALSNLNLNLNLKPSGEISLSLSNGERDSLSGGLGANVDKSFSKTNGGININIGNRNPDLNLDKLEEIDVSGTKTKNLDQVLKNDKELNINDKIKFSLDRLRTMLESENLERVLKNDNERNFNMEIKSNLDGLRTVLNTENEKIVPKNDKETNFNEEIKLNVNAERTDLNSENFRKGLANDNETIIKDETKLNLEALRTVLNSKNLEQALINKNESKVRDEIKLYLDGLRTLLSDKSLKPFEKQDEETKFSGEIKSNLDSERSDSSGLLANSPNVKKEILNASSMNVNESENSNLELNEEILLNSSNEEKDSLSRGAAANTESDELVPKINDGIDLNIGAKNTDPSIRKLEKINISAIKTENLDQGFENEDETKISGEVKLNLDSLNPLINSKNMERTLKNDEETNFNEDINLKLDREIDDSGKLNEDIINADKATLNTASILKPNEEVSMNISNTEKDSSSGKTRNIDISSIKTDNFERVINNDKTSINGEIKINPDTEKTQDMINSKSLGQVVKNDEETNINGEIKLNLDNKRTDFNSEERVITNEEEPKIEEEMKFNLDSERVDSGQLNADLPNVDIAKANSSSININTKSNLNSNSEISLSLSNGDSLSGGVGAIVDLGMNLEKSVEKFAKEKVINEFLMNSTDGLGGEINDGFDLNINSENSDLNSGKLDVPSIKTENSGQILKNDREKNIEDKVKLNLDSENSESNFENSGQIEKKISKNFQDPRFNGAINLNQSSITENSSSKALENVELEIISNDYDKDENIPYSTANFTEPKITPYTTDKVIRKEKIDSQVQALDIVKITRNLENVTTSNDEGKLKVVNGEVNLPPYYNPLMIPKPNYGKSFGKYISGPLFTLMFINILGISDIDELKHQISFDADMTVEWIDGEIFDISSSLRNPIKNETLVRMADNILSPVFFKKIWRPDLYMNGLVNVNTPTISNKAVTLLKINSITGFISYKVRMTITVSCPMSFKYYPADTQNCEFRLASYSHPSSDMSLDWLELKTSKTENFTGVRIVDPTDDNFDLRLESVGKLSYTPKLDNAPNNSYDVLTFTIAARRKMSYHLIQTYLPSFFTIFITWLVFLIPYSLYDCRIGTTMTTLLILIVMFSAVREESPQVNYIKAIDLWMLACVAFIFLNLVELILMTWLRIKIETFDKKQKADREKLDKENVVNEKNEALDLKEDPSWKVREFQKMHPNKETKDELYSEYLERAVNHDEEADINGKIKLNFDNERTFSRRLLDSNSASKNINSQLNLRPSCEISSSSSNEEKVSIRSGYGATSYNDEFVSKVNSEIDLNICIEKTDLSLGERETIYVSGIETENLEPTFNHDNETKISNEIKFSYGGLRDEYPENMERDINNYKETNINGEIINLDSQSFVVMNSDNLRRVLANVNETKFNDEIKLSNEGFRTTSSSDNLNRFMKNVRETTFNKEMSFDLDGSRFMSNTENIEQDLRNDETNFNEEVRINLDTEGAELNSSSVRRISTNVSEKKINDEIRSSHEGLRTMLSSENLNRFLINDTETNVSREVSYNLDGLRTVLNTGNIDRDLKNDIETYANGSTTINLYSERTVANSGNLRRVFTNVNETEINDEMKLGQEAFRSSENFNRFLKNDRELNFNSEIKLSLDGLRTDSDAENMEEDLKIESEKNFNSEIKFNLEGFKTELNFENSKQGLKNDEDTKINEEIKLSLDRERLLSFENLEQVLKNRKDPKINRKMKLSSEITDSRRLLVGSSNGQKKNENFTSININKESKFKPNEDIAINLGNEERYSFSGRVGSNVDNEELVSKINSGIDLNIGYTDSSLEKLEKYDKLKVKTENLKEVFKNDQENEIKDGRKFTTVLNSENMEKVLKPDRKKLDVEEGVNRKNEAVDLGDINLDSRKIGKYRKIYRFFNKYSFIGFAGLFLIFNLFYWTWLLLASEYFN